jgi:hypothetical protein
MVFGILSLTVKVARLWGEDLGVFSIFFYLTPFSLAEQQGGAALVGNNPKSADHMVSRSIRLVVSNDQFH